MKQCVAIGLCILILCISVVTVFAVPEEASNELHISMKLEATNDSAVTVSLTDSNGGYVAYWPVSLAVNGEVVEEHTTDVSGQAVFYYDIPDDKTNAIFTAIDGEYDGIKFIGCSKTMDGAVVSVETQSGASSEASTDETTVASDETATTTALSIVTQKTTMEEILLGVGVVSKMDSLSVAPTSIEEKGDKVGVGVDVDDGICNATQMPGGTLNQKARMWMDKSKYAELVSAPTATVHLELLYNEKALDRDALIEAKNLDVELRGFEDTEVKGFAMDMNMIYIDGENRVKINDPGEGTYTIELPVPTTMAGCDKYAIAVCTANGVDSFLQIKPTGGMLKFSVKRFQTLALVGFGGNAAVGSIAQTPVLLIVIGVVGLVLIAAGVAIFVFVPFRRKKMTIDPNEENDAKDVTRKVMLEPTAEVIVETGDYKEEVDKPVLLHYDVQSELSSEERERFRAKEVSADQFEQIFMRSVPPSMQINPSQREAMQFVHEADDETDNDDVEDILDEILGTLDSDTM